MEKSLPTLDKTVIKGSIYDITFGEYVELALGNFRILTSDETIPDEELTTIRQIILAQFAEATGDYNFIATMQASAKSMKLGLKLLGLTLSEKLLTVMYSPETWGFLQEHGIISKSARYPSSIKEVEDAVSRIKSEISITKIDLAELEAIETKSRENEPERTENDIRSGFTKLLASVSQYVKFSVTHETNCAVVAEYVNRLRKYQESQENNK